ncbi:hypothetical protein CEXT_353671 [Caerostris extrusa]|uniref:Uncharacterized protein n=1 Tax=Caerostris extrusa TaxID=172846 RepID=A0AAV4QV75_CAEEX|nr:hypothetical protein CEXT_353671 [Caerostris extrusa]
MSSTTPSTTPPIYSVWKIISYLALIRVPPYPSQKFIPGAKRTYVIFFFRYKRGRPGSIGIILKVLFCVSERALQQTYYDVHPYPGSVFFPDLRDLYELLIRNEAAANAAPAYNNHQMERKGGRSLSAPALRTPRRPPLARGQPLSRRRRQLSTNPPTQANSFSPS